MRLMSMWTSWVLILLVLALTGCADQSGQMAEPSPTGAEPVSTTRLTITVQPALGQPAETWTLTCDPPGGDHPHAEAACRSLENAGRDPFAPVPRGMMCAQQYGGPQTATIQGTWSGESVSAAYKRTDGCEIARWDAISDVLGSGTA
jgi:hypothetical protein